MENLDERRSFQVERHCARVSVRISPAVATAWQPGPSFRGKAEKMRLDQKIVSVQPAPLKQVWATCRPIRQREHPDLEGRPHVVCVKREPRVAAYLEDAK